VSLRRERLELSPVYATTVEHGGHTLGYIRLVNFGAHAAADMEKAMDRLEARARSPYAPCSAEIMQPRLACGCISLASLGPSQENMRQDRA